MQHRLNVHHFQHVSFEGLGSIGSHLRERGHRLSATHWYRGDSPPDLENCDWLIVMGGPMGVADHDLYPWLSVEKRLIAEALDAGKTVLGICLGAQLIAEVMGARIGRNPYREIGWFPIERSNEATTTCLGSVLPDRLDVFHWHGDRFEIPAGATPLAASAACDNQGFIVDDRVLGFQCHLETTPESMRLLIENGRDELDGSRFVQAESEMLADDRRFSRINGVMAEVLQRLENGCRSARGDVERTET